MFRELEFQTKVFNTLDSYLEALIASKESADRVQTLKQENPDIDISTPDFTEKAFEQLRGENKLPPSRFNIDFSPRKDGVGRPIPNVTLKVPTGGGKTWIAIKSTAQILNKYLGQNHGFILWIVPNEAIYSQTLKNFKNRDHPYRQAFDRAAAGRVKILTKTDRLNKQDVETHLCVMVLMLQSANRQSKETLKMFQDRGDIRGFSPPDGDQEGHKELLNTISNLDGYNDAFSMVKDSLGNALRIIRPVVVMDEGHRAVADLAYQTLYGFNPSFMLELTATPKDVQPRGGKKPHGGRFANLLVEVTGLELEAEGMIKMPLTLDPRMGTDWKATLNAAADKVNDLQLDASNYQANSNQYIRPILLVQVERTGKDQRDGTQIHAEDAKAHLMQIGFDEDEIAIKTAETNDLKTPENQNLSSKTNRVRAIITKEALQEGWDCPFAYVLCALASRNNLNAMTQLIGRILRQPNAEKTQIESLDKCYIFTHQTKTNELITAVKNGLEKDGLGDLVLEVTTEATDNKTQQINKVQRREDFKKINIYLPKVMATRDGEIQELDYETDILAKVDWSKFDSSEILQYIHLGATSSNRQIQEIHLSQQEGETIAATPIEERPEFTPFDAVLAVQKISDIVLNPFVARDIVGKTIATLKQNGHDEGALGVNAANIAESLRKALLKYQDSQAENCFKQNVTNGQIQFKLRADGRNWEMPKTIYSTEISQANQLVDANGQLMQKSLFNPIYQTEFNNQEKDVAVYLDGQNTLKWWHRNIAKKHYRLQGWRKNSIYPDFIFSTANGDENAKLVVLEMKGDHLSGNEDTKYKDALMKLLTQNYGWDDTHPIGEFELQKGDKIVVCNLIMFDNWEAELPQTHFPE